jgi:ferredoxin
MVLQRLKSIRVVVSVGVFVLMGFLFLDIGNFVPSWVTSAVVSFQLIPALTKSLLSPGIWMIGVAAILLLTALFGRVYCSTLCPLGTLQDLIIRLARKRDRRRRFKYSKPNYALHYVVLGATALLALMGSMVLLNILEPFSNFGRMLQGLVRPVVVGVNNGAAGILGWFGMYNVVQVPLGGFGIAVVAVPLVFLGVLFFLSYYHGRLFCNTLCPAGALLGLVSRVSLFKIVIDESTCKDCGLCAKVCKARCIDAENHVVDFSACVSCFNCIDSCPTVGLKYEGFRRERSGASGDHVDGGRRNLLAGAMVSAMSVVTSRSDSVVSPPPAERQRFPVTPPGSRGIGHFTQLCTACHLCVSTCPTQVLTPSLLEYGVAGLFQPKMDYWVSYCNYDCNLCSMICPSGAILPIALLDKKLVQLGKAQFVKDDCIVITKKTECGACSEHCPTKAVHMIPHEKLMLPEVNNDICVGCGACEHSCPTKPRKAIYVESNVVHLAAKKPEVKKLEQQETPTTEFPF